MTAKALVRVGQLNQAARQGAYILIALALPRLGLSRADIGEWETLQYIGYVLGFSWTTGLLQGFLVHIGKLGDGGGRRFAARAVTAIFALSVAVLGVATLLRLPLFDALQISGTPTGWYYFFVLLLSRWPAYTFEQGLLLTGQGWALLTYAAVNTLGTLLSFLLPVYLGGGLLDGLEMLAWYAGAKAIAILVWTWIGRGADPDPRYSWPAEMREWGGVSWPLMAYATAAALVVAVDPWVVNYWSGGDEATFAIFRYGVRELPLLAALIGGMTTVAVPAIARDRGEGLPLLRTESRKLFHYVFALALVMMLTADWWWTAVFTPVFEASLPVFRAYLLVVGCRLVFAMTVLTALNHTRRLYLWALLELVVNLALSLALAPVYGLVGIVWATVIASYFHELCLVLYLRYRGRTGWRSYADLRWYGFYLLLLLGDYWLVS